MPVVKNGRGHQWTAAFALAACLVAPAAASAATPAPVATSAAAVGSLKLVPDAHPAPEPLATRAARKPTYASLSTVGITALSGTVDGRKLTVRITATKRVELRLATVRGTKVMTGWKVLVVKPGRYRLVATLSKKPKGGPQRLRVTALLGRVAAREFRPLTFKSPANRAPLALALKGSSVAENQPAGTTVGTLSAVDKDKSDRLTFSLAPGAGDRDNGGFSIDGTTLKTAAPLDFEAGATRTVRLRATDAAGASFDQPATIAVTDVDDATRPPSPPPPMGSGPVAPRLTGSASAGAYTENAAPVVVDPQISATNADSDRLSSAVVQITDGGNGGDALTFTPAAGIAGSFTNANTVLTLSGPATAAEYTAVLRSVRFSSTSDDPNPTRVVRFTVSDGGLESAPFSRTIAVEAVNDAPTVTTSPGPVAYTEGDPATDVDGFIRVADVDSQIAGATARISGGFVPGEDVLVGTPGNPTMTVAYDAATGTVTFSGPGTPLAYRAALSTVSYRNTSSDPSTAPRTISYSATDAAGATSAPATRTVTVSAVDDPPVAVADAFTVPEDAVSVVLDVLANDTDVDGGPMFVSGVTAASHGTIWLAAGVVRYTPDRDHCTTYPGGTPDAFTYQSNGSGPFAPATIAVTCSPDAPTLTTSGTLAYTENDPATPIAPALTLVDPDPEPNAIAGATVRITSGQRAGEDTLAMPPTPGISQVWSVGSGTLTLTGVGTPAAYQAALRSVTYVNSSDGPSETPRVVTFTATDVTGTPTSGSRTITVTGTPDAPRAEDDGYSLFTTGVAVCPAACGPLGSDSDPDPGDTLSIVAINGLPALSQTLPSGATIVMQADGAFTYDPRPAFASTPVGQSVTDSFTYTVRDSTGREATATVELSIYAR